MILQALNRYYDILSSDPQSGIAPFGYSVAGVNFALNLSREGELLDIFPLYEQVQRGKKSLEVPKMMIVPQHVKRSSGISSNFLCDNSVYVLGISDRDETNPNYARKRFEAFREWNISLLEKASCPPAKAVLSFLNTYNPQHAREHPVIAAHLENLMKKGGNLVFKLDGIKGFIHENLEIQRIWEAHKVHSKNEVISQCLVTGKMAPVARLHTNLKGVRGAKSSGAALVSFNERAYESYNKTKGQGLNSPVSEKAVFAYTTVLNYLLSPGNEAGKFTIGDTTVVYWAESAEKIYAAIFCKLFGPQWEQTPETDAASTPVRDKEAELRIREIANKVKRGQKMDVSSLLQGLDPNTRFYVLGLAPNAARVSVRFFYTDPFQKMIKKIMTHYANMQIVKQFENQPDAIPLWQIINETVSKKSRNKEASPLMAGAVFRAILTNSPYPAALYYAIINRIRADMDDQENRIEKINYVRAAIIKAFLTRKYRNQYQNPILEVLCMSLNERSTNQAYLLGRLFAVLEKAQQDASGGNLNATIKDRYFTSACASPATVFPVLLRLAQHHISKAEYGYTSDRRIEEIMGLLDVENDPYPSHLSLDQQGIFVLGYYHQRAALYTKKEKVAVIDDQESEH